MCFALGVTLLGTGCGSTQRDATEAAINAAQTAINAARDTIDKFVPEQTKIAQDALQAAREALTKGDYGAALNGARDATQKTKDAAAAAAAKKDEWTKTWAGLNESVPKSFYEVQVKLDGYKKYGRLPKGVDGAQMETAAAQFDQLKQGWADAKAAYKTGHFADAMQKASSFSEGLQKLKELLGIQL